MTIALGAIVVVTALICASAIFCGGGKLAFERGFYFVCYRMSDNAISASSLSETASSYGGAGYILSYGGNYYVTLSCYYKNDEAKAVCANLKKRDLNCTVLAVKTKEFRLASRNAEADGKLYLGNFNTLSSLSTLAYECANGLDTGKYSQSEAKRVLDSIADALNGLLKANPNNCFTAGLRELLKNCDEMRGGYLLSKNLRYIQIALADKIINARLN